jgi:hypothetical protein
MFSHFIGKYALFCVCCRQSSNREKIVKLSRHAIETNCIFTKKLNKRKINKQILEIKHFILCIKSNK